MTTQHDYAKAKEWIEQQNEFAKKHKIPNVPAYDAILHALRLAEALQKGPQIEGLGEALRVNEFDPLNITSEQCELITQAATCYHKITGEK